MNKILQAPEKIPAGNRSRSNLVAFFIFFSFFFSEGGGWGEEGGGVGGVVC